MSRYEFDYEYEQEWKYERKCKYEFLQDFDS